MGLGRQGKNYERAVFFFQWRIDGHVMRGDYYQHLLNPPTTPRGVIARTLPLEIGVRNQFSLQEKDLNNSKTTTLDRKMKTQMQHWTESHQHGTENTTMIIYNFRNQNFDTPVLQG